MDVGPWSTQGPYRFSKADMVQPRGGSAAWTVDGTRAVHRSVPKRRISVLLGKRVALLDFASALPTLASAKRLPTCLGRAVALVERRSSKNSLSEAVDALTPSLRSKGYS